MVAEVLEDEETELREDEEKGRDRSGGFLLPESTVGVRAEAPINDVEFAVEERLAADDEECVRLDRRSAAEWFHTLGTASFLFFSSNPEVGGVDFGRDRGGTVAGGTCEDTVDEDEDTAEEEKTLDENADAETTEGTGATKWVLREGGEGGDLKGRGRDRGTGIDTDDTDEASEAGKETKFDETITAEEKEKLEGKLGEEK